MSNIKTVTLAAPASWASYLINRDDSGMEQSEVQAVNSWLVYVEDAENVILGEALSCGEDYVGRWHRQVCTVCDYVFPIVASIESYTGA